MKIFYYCFAGVHSSIIAGYIHLNKLPRDRVPTVREILNSVEFDNSRGRDFGIPYFLGKDEQQNEIYVLGFGKNRALGLQTIIHLLAGYPQSMEYKFLNALDHINWLTRIGGFMSQQLQLKFIGKNLAARGIQMTYVKFVNLVAGEKRSTMKTEATKRKIIVITDGDRVAQKVVEKVATNIGGRTISLSGGNPTGVSGRTIAEAVKKTPYDPVLVMVDDCGAQDQGKGEQVLEYLAHEPDLEILGVVAVASNTAGVDGVPVTASVSREGAIVDGPVDKDGHPEPSGHRRVEGDTVDILNQLNIPIVIGVGDLGKMEFADEVANGARITTIAVNEVIKRSGYHKE